MVTATVILPQQHHHQPQLVEVIGGNGRIGSQFMRLLSRRNATAALSQQQQPSPMAVPRGVCAGSISSSIHHASTTTASAPNINPIFVCTPSSTWSTIYETTTPSWRCSDLVFIGNGLLPHNIVQIPQSFTGDDNGSRNNSFEVTATATETTAATEIAAITIVIPHYGILNVGDRPTTTRNEGNSRVAPPTFIAGKHSHMVKNLLELDGITNIRRYDTINADVIKYMIQKVIWTSCLWLLCHTMNHQNSSNSNNLSLSSLPLPPLTVAQVHVHHKTTLYALVEELWPSIEHIYWTELNRWIHLNTTTDIPTRNCSVDLPMTIADVIQYMEDYSFSIPNAIPSKALAIQEIASRNKIFTDCCHDISQQQPIHDRLLQQIFSSTDAKRHLPNKTLVLPRSLEGSPPRPTATKVVDLRPMIGMAVYGQQRQRYNDTVIASNPNDSTDSSLQQLVSQKKRIVIVGAGILGSSVAFNLARLWHHQKGARSEEGIAITVVDSQCSDINDTNTTTKSSFGWINANFMKQPMYYQTLNILGIHAWYNDPVLKSLPRWNGSIIRQSNATDANNTFIADTAGYYNQCIGPLSDSDTYSLEPNASFTSDNVSSSNTYFFPNEGFVDPCDTVHTMRNEAKRLGVSFIWNSTIQGISTRHPILNIADQPPVYYVEYQNTSGTICTIEADVVVIAAGIGSSSIGLGGLPMQQTNVSGSTTQLILDNQNFHSAPTGTVQIPNDVLQHIVVDMVNETHILQRPNGTIVVGGGSPLRVGGTNVGVAAATNDVTNNVTLGTSSRKKDWAIPTRVQKLIPNILDTMIVDQIHVAERPIPLDGLPAIGYYHLNSTNEKNIKNIKNKNPGSCTTSGELIGDGIYYLVSHSGITLSPLLGALAAIEILHPHLSLELLRSYRPNRLFMQKSNSL